VSLWIVNTHSDPVCAKAPAVAMNVVKINATPRLKSFIGFPVVVVTCGCDRFA